MVKMFTSKLDDSTENKLASSLRNLENMVNSFSSKIDVVVENVLTNTMTIGSNEYLIATVSYRIRER